MLTRSRTAIFLLKICMLFALFGFSPAQAQVNTQATNGIEVVVRVTATAQVTPAQITLSWPVDANATAYTVARTLQGTTTGSVTIPVANAATSTGVVDTTVVAGHVYEYTVVKQRGGNLPTQAGYVASGINVPLTGGTGQRGKIILVVANDAFADTRISLGLHRLIQDLQGDGWTAILHTVPRDLGINAAGIDIDHGTAIRSLKATIRADYNADPANVKAVFLFGHVPVPYSGDFAPDNILNHIGAWSADIYYADMGLESYWTDNAVNDTAADDKRNWNVPGDGKFDENVASGAVQLEVGRVDLANMPSFAPQTEFDLLTQYLDKDHNYRQGYTTAEPIGRIANFDGDVSQDAWRSFSALFGALPITTSGPNTLIDDLTSGSFLWAEGDKLNSIFGYYNSAPDVAATADFAANDPHSMFYMLFGEFSGDWDHADDLLRAPLATTTYGLTSVWAGNPLWYFHDMGMGSEIGYSTRLTQNLYNPAPSQVHAALMGDPTLREHIVSPPANLLAVAQGSDVLLTWDTSKIGTNDINQVTAYNVYRKDPTTGDFVFLATLTAPAASYTDTGSAGQSSVYQVRAVSPYISLTGIYANQSQGAFAAYNAAHIAPTIVLVSPIKDAVTNSLPTTPAASFLASDTAPVTVTLAAQANSSITGDTPSVTFYQNSTAVGTITTPPYQTTVTLKPGDYVFSAVVTDGAGAVSASNLLPVNVYDVGEGGSPYTRPGTATDSVAQTIYSGTLRNGWTDVSVKTIGTVTQMSDAFGVTDPNPINSPVINSVASVTLTTDNSSFILKHLPIDPARYPGLHLEFWINGGTVGGQNLSLRAPLQDSVTPDLILHPAIGRWTFVSLPLSGLVAAGDRVRNIDGFRISSNDPGPTPIFYIGDVRLGYNVLRPNRAPGVAIHLINNLSTTTTRFTVAQVPGTGQPITGIGDAGTSDGTITEVDLSVDGVYYGRGVSAGPPAHPYSPFTTQLQLLTPGVHALQAAAVTSYGATAQSIPFDFTVVGLPTVAITTPTDGKSFVPSTPIQISATAAAATNGVLSKVQFYQRFNGGTAVQVGTDIAAPGTYAVTITPSVVGTYALTAVATDDLGGATTSTPITIHVGNAPTVKITSPANDAPFAASTVIPITAAATAGSNPIAKVDFYSDGTLIGTDSTSPYTFSYTNAAIGAHSLTAITTDTIGLTATSAPIVIHVGTPPTVAITAPATHSPFTAPGTIPVAATATAGSNPIVRVDFYADGVLIGSDTSSPYTATYASVPVGTHFLAAKATDSIGLSTLSASISVFVGNPPSVKITSPTDGQAFVFPVTIPVTATVTQGTNAITKVDFYADGKFIGTDTSFPYTTSYANVPVGTHILTATVTDGIKLTATSPAVNIAVNSKPTVTITAPIAGATFIAPVTVPITASATPGNHPIAKVDFYADGVLIGTATSSPYTVSYANVPVGTISLVAKATDTIGLSALSTVVKILVNSKPSAYITSPVNGQTFVAPATVPLAATASPGNHPITKVEFYVDGTLVGTATTSPYTATYSNVAQGTYSLVAKVTDTIGLSTLSQVVTFIVNTRPSITITTPANGAKFVTPVTLPVAATATPGNHPIAQVDFYADGALIGTSKTSPYSVSYANILVGTHALTAKATDTIGLTAVSVPVTIVVNTLPTVTITSPSAGTPFVAPATIPIAASVTPGNNAVTKVDFFANGTLISTATSSPYTISYANVPAGTYALTAKVTDSAGLTATSAPVTVTVVIHQTLVGLVTRSFDNQAVPGITLTFKSQANGSTPSATSVTASTGFDGKMENYTRSGLEPGAYTVTLTYLGSVVAGPQTITVSSTQPTRADFSLSTLHTFPSGQQMFSVPYDYSGTGMSLSEILATSDASVTIWDSLSTYHAASTLTLGQGYFGTFPTGVHIWLPGNLAPTTQPFSIPLKAGWNMIGDPFLSSVSLGNIQVVTSGGTTFTLASAVDHGVIGTNLETFFAGDTSYRLIPVSSGGSLAPYSGYWIHALQSCTLSVPAP